MPAGDDGAFFKGFECEVADVFGLVVGGGEFQHLIEVAIKYSAIPTNGQHLGTHDSRSGCWIESLDQFRHVRFVVAFFPQVI